MDVCIYICMDDDDTLDVPWFYFIEIDVTYDIHVCLQASHLLLQIIVQELLLGWMEAKTWRHAGLTDR